MGAPVLPSQHEGATQMYINFGSINSRQAADGSCTAPLTVDSCGTCRLKKHASLPTITRYDENAYQLFYIAAGKAYFWFDDAEHVVTAGHMVLYRPQEERHYIYYLEDHPEVSIFPAARTLQCCRRMRFRWMAMCFTAELCRSTKILSAA